MEAAEDKTSVKVQDGTAEEIHVLMDGERITAFSMPMEKISGALMAITR